MSVTIWVVQILLASLLLLAGSIKVLSGKAKLQVQMPSLENLPFWQVKAIGILEIAAAAGLVLPMLTGISPWLTPLAAGGVILTMIGAIALHLGRQEPKGTIVPVLALILAVVVVYGRIELIPVMAKL